MDPASAIGVASAVITFVEFAAKLISGAMEVYESADGSMKRDTHTLQISNDFDSLSQKLQQLTICSSPLSEDEKELHRIAEQSRETCGELRRILMGLTAGGKSKWSSIKTVWKSRRMEDDVQVLHSQLRDYRSEILLRLSKMQLDGNAQLRNQLAMLRKAVQQTIRTDEETEANIRGRILDQLSFESMSSRRENISEPEAGTLDWIIDRPEDYEDHASHDVPDEFIFQQKEARKEARNSYMSWLKGNAQPIVSSSSSAAPNSTPASSVLFISGKAGSGKSTLMHRLFEHSQSHPDMLEWANNRNVVFVSFYFWVASSDKLQMTIGGLYRSVLYSVVDQCPELGPVLFPDQWQAIHDRIRRKVEDPSGKLDAAHFSGKALRVAFERIFDRASTLAHRYCFCFFLDGLDEYRATANYGQKSVQNAQQSGMEIARNVLQWSNAEHVRICCSARPHAEFEFLLSKATTLRLEKANLCDIYRYCKQTLEKNDDFGQFGTRSGSLAYTLTARCEGVFLWALLTVKILIPALNRGASDAELETKLTAIPDGIDALYDELLSQVDGTDRERSNQLLLLVLKSSGLRFLPFLSTTWVLWIDEVLDANKPLGDSLDNYQRDRRIVYSRKAELKINHLTRGILEVPSKKKIVGFFHRTAHDYVQERHSNGQLRSDILDFEDNGIYARLFVANYVHVYRDFDVVLGAIERCAKVEETRLRSLAFLADSVVLGIRQRYHLFPGEDHFHDSEAVRFTTSSCRSFSVLNSVRKAEENERTPMLAGITNIGYTLTLRSADSCGLPEKAFPFYSFLNSSGLFGVILGYVFRPWGDFETNMSHLLQGNETFSSFLGGETNSGLPYPPWMFLSACIINLTIYGHTTGKMIFYRRMMPPYDPEEIKILLRSIIPPEAQHEAVITLTKTGAGIFPTMDEILTVCIEEDTDDADETDLKDTDLDSYPPHVASIVYQDYRVDRDTALLIMCPGLCEEI